MSKKLIAAVIVGRLALAPGAAAAPPDGRTPLADAARQEAVRAAHAAQRGPMPAGLKWTGIGLIIGSGMGLVGGELGDCLASEETCRRSRHTAHIVLGAMAGTGVALLLVGDHKRPALPSLRFDAERITISQRLTF
jgi:hypothetical protein